MSLSHAILGFLNERSLTGYDLKVNCFDTSVVYFWPADQAQIYRTLDKLTEQGFIESTTEYQEDRPNRKVYSITEMGRAELRAWLATPQPLPTHREPFLIQLFFGDHLTDETLIRLLEEQLALHRAQLAGYQQIALPTVDTPGMTRPYILQRLTLDMGIQSEEMYIKWLEASIEIVRHLRD